MQIQPKAQSKKLQAASYKSKVNTKAIDFFAMSMQHGACSLLLKFRITQLIRIFIEPNRSLTRHTNSSAK
jgi:hypothetical protein